MKKLMAMLLVFVMAAALFCGTALADEDTFSFRMSCEASEGQWLAEFLQEYADAINEATEGKVTIELYLGNSLGSAEDIWNMFTMNAVEMMHCGVGHAGHFPVTDFVQTPFTVDSPEAAGHVMEVLAEGGYLTEFTDNMQPLMYMPTLMQEIIMIDKNVETVEDLAGLNIRASAKPLADCVTNLGSTPVSIPIPELYMSLSQGVADGAITSIDAADVFKLEEICKYWIDLPVCTGMNYVGMNLEAWAGLPEDVQEAILTVSAEYQDKYYAVNNEAAEACRANFVEAGCEIVEPTEELIEGCKEATAAQVQGLIDALNGEGLDGEAIVAAAQAAVEEFAAEEPAA